MEREVPKQIYLPPDLAAKIDELVEANGGKGQLKPLGAAAFLMYLRAPEKERQRHRELAEQIRRGLLTVDGAVGEVPEGGADLLSRLEEMEKAIKRIGQRHRRKDAAAKAEENARRVPGKRSIRPRRRGS